MKASRFTEEQVVVILVEADRGERKMGICDGRMGCLS